MTGEQSLSFSLYVSQDRLGMVPNQYFITWSQGVVEPSLSWTTKGRDVLSRFTGEDGDLIIIL